MILKSYEVEKIKSQISNKKICLLYGENLGIKKDIKNSIEITIKKNESTIEKLTLFEDDIIKNPENFYNLIFSGSLFSDKKIITVFNASDKITTHIEEIIDKFPDKIFLFLFSEILEKKSKLRILFEKENKIICVPCYADNEKSLELIAAKELKKEKIFLSRESLNLLIRKSEGDRNNLRNELEKIKSFGKDEKKIEYEKVKYLINSSIEIKSDNLINICLCGDTFELKKILENSSTEHFNHILLLKVLGNKIRRLLSIKEQNKEIKNWDGIIHSIKPPIFWKEKPFIKKQLSIWNLNELKKTISEINDIEIACRKNPNISSIVFSNFFTSLCKKTSYQI